MPLLFILIINLCIAYEPEVSVSAPWSVVQNAPGTFTVTHRDHAAALIVTSDESKIGLTVSYLNRKLHTTTASGPIPTFLSPLPTSKIETLRFESQGIDLLIRIEGSTIREWTGSPSAPDDPVITWFRVRVRNDAIRVITQGLVALTLPASTEGPYPSPTADGGISFTHGFGRWSIHTDAKGLQGQKTQQLWWLDTTPSIDLKQPYPKTTIEWSPNIGIRHP